ncbi:MAG TPA: hypothetical protein VK470_10885 [Bacteroidota bacterium]|nr:hypothetical protein [Bacteroidota bacterium]
MGRVRQLQRDDLSRVVELNNKLFPTSVRIPFEDQLTLFERVCFKNPWHDNDITSLVYEDDQGVLAGFLCVLARPMLLGSRQIRAAVFQHMMVDRSTLASFQMFRALVEGPQDFSMGENAVDVVCKLWTRLGHPVSRLNSIYWRRFLKPVSIAAHQAARRSSLRAVARASMPVCRAVDALLERIPGNPLRVGSHDRRAVSSQIDEELETAMMLGELPRMTTACALHPVYTAETLDWLLHLLSEETRNGRLQKKLVRDPSGAIDGWYIYYLNSEGPSPVFQIAAVSEQKIGHVLDHLFAHAQMHGALELTGRIEPRYMKALREKRCYFMPGRNWMLVHSHDPEILHAIDRGDAFLSRLEGDLWVL